MRIIGGAFKGRKLFLPNDKNTRPLKDLVKESIFNLIQHSNKINIEIKNSSVLDLFSGTGNISYEFASRGTKKVVAVDGNYNCVKYINATAKEFNFDIITYKSDVYKFLEKTTLQSDVIFADPPYDFDALDLQTEVADERFEAEEAREEGLDDAELALQELLERKRMRNLNPKQRERFVERMRSLDADEFASQVELEGYKENIRQMDSLAGPKRAEALALMAAEMMRQSGKKENEIQALLDRWADEYEQEPRKAIERMEASIHYDKMRKVNDQVGKAAKWALWRGSALAIGAGAAGLFGLRTGWQAFGIARRAAKLGAKSMWNTLTEGFQEFVGQKDKKIGVTEGNKDLDRQWANVEEDVADLAADTQSRVTGDNEAIKKRKEARDARWAEKQKKKEKEKKKEAKKKAA